MAWMTVSKMLQIFNEPGMSEIDILTDPIPFRWMECEFWKIPFPVNLIPFNQKNTVPVHSIKILFDDRTRSVMKEIYHSLSFISLILFNLIYLVKSCLYWWNINKTHSKTKEQMQEIQINSAKIQVLMRTNEILW